MRPEAFVLPMQPEVVDDSLASSCAFHYRLVTVGGREVVASVTLTRRAREFATQYPHDTDPEVFGAITSRGLTVVRSHVLHREDPMLDWIVYADGIAPGPGEG